METTAFDCASTPILVVESLGFAGLWPCSNRWSRGWRSNLYTNDCTPVSVFTRKKNEPNLVHGPVCWPLAYIGHVKWKLYPSSTSGLSITASYQRLSPQVSQTTEFPLRLQDCLWGQSPAAGKSAVRLPHWMPPKWLACWQPELTLLKSSPMPAVSHNCDSQTREVSVYNNPE